MKIIILDDRYRLSRDGFNYAIRFHYYHPKYDRLKDILSKMYGARWTELSTYDSNYDPKNYEWATYHAKKQNYWYIGVRHKEALTAALLGM